MKKKTLKINILLIFLFIFCSSCVKNVKNCGISTNYKEIGELIIKNASNFSNLEIKNAQITCKF